MELYYTLDGRRYNLILAFPTPNPDETHDLSQMKSGAKPALYASLTISDCHCFTFTEKAFPKAAIPA